MVLSNPLGNNGGRFYSTLVKPVLIDCSFVVDPSNVNGAGVSSLKGSGVQAVFMHNTASITGTTHTNTVIDGIASTANLVVGMGLSGSGIVVGTKIASITSSTAITVSIATTASATVSIVTSAVGSPNPAAGYVLVQLKNNYAKYAGGFNGFVAPTTGGNVAINSTSLTVGNPYVISAVGHASAGTVTIQPVADSSGSLASTWFSLYDAYGNTFIIWFKVSGVGSAPIGVSGTLVQQSISANDSAGTIGAALVTTIQNLPSGVSGVSSFTASGTTTVTVVSTATNPYGPVAGVPQDGLIPTGFTFAQTVYKTNLQNWQNVGVPKGIAPAVGVSFIAIATGDSTGGGSTGTVVVPSVTGVTGVELVGDPSLSLGPVPMGGSPNVGGFIMAQFVAPTSASVTTAVATAPASSSVVKLAFYVEQSSVVISGE